MKMKTLLSLIFLTALCSILSAQEYAVDKKATIISGTASFSNRGGSLFENGDGKNATLITFAPTVNHFIFKNFFIGGGLEISSDSQSDYHSSAFGIGPQIGYAFGNAQGSVYPYVDLGIRYYNMVQDYGSIMGDLKLRGRQKLLGFGVIVPLKTHIGLIIEGGYQMIDLKSKKFDYGTSGRIFSVGIGISGLIFRSDL